MQDLKYRDFHSKLMPTVDKEKVIGVRTPELRKFAKEIAKTAYSKEFLANLPHEYYEENNLHAFLIEEIKDYYLCIAELNRFLPYVDNWATCDMMRPKIFRKHLPELLVEIQKWLNSKDTYTLRFGMEMLMVYYLDENFKTEYADAVAEIRSDEYYIKMAIAWLYSVCLVKEYDKTVKVIENKLLDKWTHNKTIQKAIESYRVSENKKAYLKIFFSYSIKEVGGVNLQLYSLII